MKKHADKDCQYDFKSSTNMVLGVAIFQKYHCLTLSVLISNQNPVANGSSKCKSSALTADEANFVFNYGSESDLISV